MCRETTHPCLGEARWIPQDASTTTLLTLNISPTEIAVPAMNSAGNTDEGFGIGAAQVSKEYDEALAKVGYRLHIVPMKTDNN